MDFHIVLIAVARFVRDIIAYILLETVAFVIVALGVRLDSIICRVSNAITSKIGIRYRGNSGSKSSAGRKEK